MQPDYSYTWESAKSGGYKTEPAMKRYGWWVSLALLLSALIHVLLYFLAEHLPPLTIFGTAKTEIIYQNRERNELSVDEATLREILREEQPAPKEVDPVKEQLLVEAELFQDEPVELEPIRLTPEVDKMQNYFAAERPASAEIADVSAASTAIDIEFAETDASAVKKQLLEAAQASINQPKLILNDSDIPDGADSDAVVEALTASLGSKETGRRISDRFNSLESLLGAGGAMPDRAEVLFPTDLLFEFNEFQLKETARLSLMKLGVLIVNYPDATFKIKGFTDSIGSQNFNLELSQKRADAVTNWLVESLRLEGYNLDSQGYGKLNPLVEPTGDKDTEALNRRVEIEIINPKR